LPKSPFIDYSVTQNRAARAEEAIQILRLSGHNPKAGGLLDLGCGAGSTTKWFSSNFGVYSVGVEVCSGFRERSRTQGPRLEYIQGSGVNLPFQEKKFHTIILNDILEHVSYEDVTELFNQVRNALEDNGAVYVSVASKFELREPHSNLLFISWFPRWIYSPVVRRIFHQDVYPYTVKRFATLAQKSRLSFENYTWFYVDKKMRNINYIGNKMVRPVARLLNKLGLTRNAGVLKFLEPFGVLVFVCKKKCLGSH
jgi:cyclopropane fatty-acyl-phospholipid synthase-like methyltransferase